MAQGSEQVTRAAETPSGDAHDFGRELPTGRFAKDGQPVTDLLYERLDPAVVSKVERRVAGLPDLDEKWIVARADPEHRRRLVLQFGIWLGVLGLAEQTGLSFAQPPEHVHSMARGPMAAAGGLYEADLVVAALASAGVAIEDAERCLDFGCSSGRVVRVLAAAYPDTTWLGCDPNEPAIGWATDNIPGVEFFVSGNEPPLPVPDAFCDVAFAISIWSHFEPALGLRWFDEMHRIVRAGGHLVFTAHGLTSIAHGAVRELRPGAELAEIAEAMYRRGWWYRAVFGERGDWGVVNPNWGTAFLSQEWVLAKLCPRWAVVEFAAGRNQSNQDVYVLERV